MKLINSKVEILEPTGYTIDDIYKQIEIAGRTCYKSEDKITPTSAKEFVDRMIKSGHGAMLEHGTVYLFCPTEEYVDSNGDVQHYNPLEKYQDNSYSALADSDEGMYITTNLRVLIENRWLDDLKYICEPTEYHKRRYTVKFICDRGVSHEFVRHRVFSFAQESTRYCNYSKDKFGNEITFIIPSWLDIPDGQYTYWDGDWCDADNMKIQFSEEEHDDANAFLWALSYIDLQYKVLLNKGWKPQQARQILPNALKTELVMTGFESDWKHFFELRCDTAAHPDARKLALELYSKLYNKEYEKEE